MIGHKLQLSEKHSIEVIGYLLFVIRKETPFFYISNIGFSGDRYPEKVVPKIVKELFTSPDITIDFFENISDEVNLEIEKAQIFLQIAG